MRTAVALLLLAALASASKPKDKIANAMGVEEHANHRHHPHHHKEAAAAASETPAAAAEQEAAPMAAEAQVEGAPQLGLGDSGQDGGEQAAFSAAMRDPVRNLSRPPPRASLPAPRLPQGAPAAV